MSATKRHILAVLAVVFAAYLGWALYYSITDIPTFNDFEVYHFIGGVAATGEPIVYELRTPQQQRGPFLYPPSASVLMIPLSWLSHDTSGAVFSLVKVLCLLLLWWGGIRFSGTPPRDALGWALVAIGPLIMLHRAVTSDVGNGQINIIVAAAGVGGVWLMMASRRAWWVGSFLLAWAIAIKMTPALLLAVPLLNKRWRALGVSIAAAAAIVIALPIAWYGVDGYRKMSGQHREIAARFTLDWPAPFEQTAPIELLQFVRRDSGRALVTDPSKPDPLPVPITGYAGEGLLDPSYRGVAFTTWLVLGLVVGSVFLVARPFILSRTGESGARSDWTWDVAMLCALIVLLSPRVQKAHLVVLIVPAAWLAARVCSLFEPDAGDTGHRRGIRCVIAYALICTCFLIADTLEVPMPGLGESLHCFPMLGLLGMIAMLIVVERIARPRSELLHARA